VFISERLLFSDGAGKMSARRRRREAPMPQSAAGLLRFFEEEIKGIKIRAELVLILAALMIAMIIVANILF